MCENRGKKLTVSKTSNQTFKNPFIECFLYSYRGSS